MLNINFVIYKDALKICVSTVGSATNRKYKSVMQLLPEKLSVPQLNKFWDKGKGKFKGTYTHAARANRALSEYQQKYSDIVIKHPDITAEELIAYFDRKHSPETIGGYILHVAELKREEGLQADTDKPGKNWGHYTDLHRRILEFDKSAGNRNISELNEGYCKRFAEWSTKRNKGISQIAKNFMCVLRTLDQDREIDWEISDLHGFNMREKKHEKNTTQHQQDALKPKQYQAFVELDITTIKDPKHPRSKGENYQIYKDMMILIAELLSRPIDIISLKCEDFGLRPDGKTFCEYQPTKKRNTAPGKAYVPLTQTAIEIIERYNWKNRQGYLFEPLITAERVEKCKDKINGIAVKLNNQINDWLKLVAPIIGRSTLKTYDFRHTGITFAINDRAHVSQVARWAGTSISMIDKTYYDGTQNTDRIGAAEYARQQNQTNTPNIIAQ